MLESPLNDISLFIMRHLKPSLAIYKHRHHFFGWFVDRIKGSLLLLQSVDESTDELW